MKFYAPFGWLLLACAFLAAAAEMAAHGQPGDSILMAARDVWSSMWPAGWRAFDGWAQQNLPGPLYDPVFVTLMSLPGWLILGLPGGLLAWFGKPKQKPIDKAYEEQLFLYDELSKQAIKDGYTDDAEDFYSDQRQHLDLDEAGGEELDLKQHVSDAPPDKFLNDWEPLGEDKEHGLPEGSEQPGSDDTHLNDWSSLKEERESVTPDQPEAPPPEPDPGAEQKPAGKKVTFKFDR